VRVLLPIAVLALASLGVAVSFQDDPRADLKSKDTEARLAAVRSVAAAPQPGDEKALLKLLKDRDWEIVMLAADGLGRLRYAKASGPLTKLAYGGPIRAVRVHAADALAELDAEEALKDLGKKCSKDTAIAACEALERVGRVRKLEKPPKSLEKLVKNKELPVRNAAARALVATAGAGREGLLSKLLDSEYLGVRACALESSRELPEASDYEVLKDYCQRTGLRDVEVRRGLDALAAAIDATEQNPSSLLDEQVRALCAAEDPDVARRGALLASRVIDREWMSGLNLVEVTEAARGHADAGVRAGAVRLLGDLDPDAAVPAAESLLDTDPEVRVRVAALGSLLRLRPVTTDETRLALIERIAAGVERDLREAMVVALGHQKMNWQGDAVQVLIDTLGDSDWGVAACAAVSLGMTRSEAGVTPLGDLAKSGTDWRLRGAAVVGLSKSLHKPAIEALIETLDDAEPLVARTAHSYLISIARGDVLPREVEPWRKWWLENKSKIRLHDPEAQRARREKYGYGIPPQELYKGLDVLVLESRGDHIQAVLDQLGIEHRMTAANRVAEDGLDAAGVFVSNCTGEMEAGDIERVAWFVKVGGYLCGSCWALSETINRIEPGIVRKLDTRNEIVDTVRAAPCDPESPYLEGVFGEHVVPLYHLEGAHVIEVLRPERVEMLIDSVECSEKWGGGNLACWFRLGHGTVLDSANHFDLQGLATASGLKKREQRMAFAVDHMGASLEEIRSTAKEKFWDSNQKAAARVRDYSVFRIVSNFVRMRRSEAYGR
jgi:HEAT repeat protein